MSARVEARRFRTWESESRTDSDHVMRTIVKYGIIRILGAWHIRLLLVLALLFIIGTLGAYSYEIAAGGDPQSGSGLDGEFFGAAVLLGFIPAFAFLMFVAAPLFAEDLRFNAPLFYFSKPVSVRDYTLGKVGLLVVLLGATVLLPLVIFLIMSFIGTLLSHAPVKPYEWESAQEFSARVAEWRTWHMDTVGDWFYAVASVIPAFLVMLLLLCSIFVAASAWTTRAWHAGIAALSFLGVLSFLGGTVQDSSNAAMGHAFGPVGWVDLLVFVPLARRFSTYDWYAREGSVFYDTYPAAVVTSYSLMLGLIVALSFATMVRLRRMEGIA